MPEHEGMMAKENIGIGVGIFLWLLSRAKEIIVQSVINIRQIFARKGPAKSNVAQNAEVEASENLSKVESHSQVSSLDDAVKKPLYPSAQDNIVDGVAEYRHSGRHKALTSLYPHFSPCFAMVYNFT